MEDSVAMEQQLRETAERRLADIKDSHEGNLLQLKEVCCAVPFTFYFLPPT